MDSKTQRICFLGKGGIGKSVITSNISEALSKKGFKILQIGNDISLSSTAILRGEMDITPALEEYRQKYDINILDYIVEGVSGVYCLELGSIEPGAGCMARGINIIDEMLQTQGVIEKLKIDYILYDIAGEIPCTGYILPIRDRIMQKCIVVTNGSFASLSTANSIIAGIVRAIKDNSLSISLLVNYADLYQARPLLEDYSNRVNLDVVAYLDYYKQIEYSLLDGKTVLTQYPEGEASIIFDEIAENVIAHKTIKEAKPFDRKELLLWSRKWKQRELNQKMGVIDVEDSGNI